MHDRSGNRAVLVLGMHRSGTSALTGTLEQAGLAVGPVGTSDSFNRKGNREHPDVLQLHRKLFAANGARWDRPPRQIDWRQKHRVARDHIIRGFADRPVWGFKDPRTVFTISGWREALQQISLVGIFRHPAAVARSLERRNGLAREHAYSLWLAYNTRLLALHRAAAFPIISFDLAPDAFARSAQTIIARLGLRASTAVNFFEERLRSEPPCDTVPLAVLRLYFELSALQIVPAEQRLRSA
jgi:hypothetical protein